MVWESDPSAMQAKTDATKLDLCNQNIKSLDLDVAKAKPGAVHKKLETLYLRTNEISCMLPSHRRLC
jgi:Leucine-rich repeat (LRR) protein